MKKREGQKRWGWLVFFLLIAIPYLTLFGFVLAVTWDIDPAMDEALFREVGADSALYIMTKNEAGDAWDTRQIRPLGRCEPLTAQELSPHLSLAFVAMEDHRFYRHGGVDIVRTLKAAGNRLLGKGSFGGSTITQQLIKNIGGERERTVFRKLREITRAHLLERNHTKEEILLAYLNIVPLGEGCVGVGAASRHYFGKEAGDLTLAEAASLAATAPAPARLSPRKNQEANKARRDRVLLRMAELGLIEEEACATALAEPLVTVAEEEVRTEALSWFDEHLLLEVKRDLIAAGYSEGAAVALLYGGGLHIYSACDMRAQRAAEAAFSRFAGEAGLHAGCALFSPETGKLIALVGDLGEKDGRGLFNYATDARRAPGSALKPIALYAPAIEEGLITEATVFDDVPKRFTATGAWPRNTPDRYDGLILAKDALIASKNTVAVDLYERLGAEHIYANLTERFRLTGLCRREKDAAGNVRTDLAPAPLALGELTHGVSLFALTRAYLPFAGEGRMYAGKSYYRVERAGRVLLNAMDAGERVLSPVTASVMTHMLAGVAEEGSAKTLSLPKLVPVAGKTGSSGGNRDRWFIGYTADLLCGVWCGYDKGGEGVTGTPHLALFDAVMTPLVGRPETGETAFSYPGLRRVTVCKDSGKMPTILCNEDERGERLTEVLVRADTHLGMCETHVSVFYDDEGKGVAYPPRKGWEGRLRRVSLIRVSDRAFPREVYVADAEYVYRDPLVCEAREGDVPFFAAAVHDGVYIGKSHDCRPFHAAAKVTVPPVQEGSTPTHPRRAARRPRLPRFPFLGF